MYQNSNKNVIHMNNTSMMFKDESIPFNGVFARISQMQGSVLGLLAYRVDKNNPTKNNDFYCNWRLTKTWAFEWVNSVTP